MVLLKIREALVFEVILNQNNFSNA